MSKHTDSSVVSVGHAGHSVGPLVHGGMRRMLLVAAGAVGVVMLAASVAFACTTYWGQITIENTSTGSGEFSVVADPSSGMDRCDSAMQGDSTSLISADNSGENVRVEISKWEPGGQDPSDEPDCEASSHGDDDGNGSDEHSLADESDVGPFCDGACQDVYINTYDGDAYEDKDGNNVYEDSDGDSDERVGDCMGDGSDSDVNNKAGPIDVLDYGSDPDGDGKDDGGEFGGVGDADGDGINDVEITINKAPASSSGFAGAICVSQGDGGDSAPQVPIEIT